MAKAPTIVVVGSPYFTAPRTESSFATESGVSSILLAKMTEQKWAPRRDTGPQCAYSLGIATAV